MAAMDESPFSLMSLEDELTCSICLSTFTCPVTIPCGHNFCQDCLLATWRDSYSCPQCRTHFAVKPELKKNTVLSTVVETFNSRTSKSEVSMTTEEVKGETRDPVRCDACMEAEASQTCLTCMASYCEEHLRPHRENPIFRVHQLSEPVGDLSERICPDHHKLMELFCSQHGRPICSLCLQQVHKGCSFVSPEEQRTLTELDLRDKLGLLDGKIEKTETAIMQLNNMQSDLQNAATKRKTALAAVYQQMRDMLTQEECVAQQEVDREGEICQTKVLDHMNTLTKNTNKMTKAKEQINSLLSRSQTVAFLQTSYNFPKTVKLKDPIAPQINLDSKKVTATLAFSAALKEHLTEIVKQPVEARRLVLKPDKQDPVSAPANTGSQTKSEVTEPAKQKRRPRSRSQGRPLIQPLLQPGPMYPFMGSHTGWFSSQYGQGVPPGAYRSPPFMARQMTKQDQSPFNAAGVNNPSGRSHPSSGKPNKQ